MKTQVVGTQHRKEAPFHQLSVDDILVLRPEPDNPYHSNAIKVMWGPHHLGYIPRDLADEITRLSQSGELTDSIDHIPVTIQQIEAPAQISLFAQNPSTRVERYRIWIQLILNRDDNKVAQSLMAPAIQPVDPESLRISDVQMDNIVKHYNTTGDFDPFNF